MSKADVSPTSLQIAILRSKASGKDDAAAAQHHITCGCQALDDSP